jgi:hypothetical protein
MGPDEEEKNKIIPIKCILKKGSQPGAQTAI